MSGPHSGMLTSLPQWQALAAHQRSIRDVHMRDLFARDPDRGRAFSLECSGLLVDFAKHRITGETIGLLVDLARATGLEGCIAGLFSGEIVNPSENRPALHSALRAPPDACVPVSGRDIIPDVHTELHRVYAFAHQLAAGEVAGALGAPIDTVVNIGIGGSDLGPRLAAAALHEYRTGGVTLHFVTNVDDQDLFGVLRRCDPARTLFVVASKSFTTLETQVNAQSAINWLVEQGCKDPAAHLCAVTARPDAAQAFGVSPDRIFRIWDWVGGRYSIWSAVGLPLVMQIGEAGFRDLLSGARAMDEHFRRAPLAENIPALLGLLDLWYAQFFGAETRAVVPYDQRLALLPEYLSQLVMESCGKRVDRDGAPLTCAGGAILWGATGTNAQHAFFQLLHQGTHLVPVDFLLPLRARYDEHHHRRLVASCLAQSQALMIGRDNAADGNRHFPGNRPSTTLVYDDMSPYMLGVLLSLYEHRTFAGASVTGINPFDQWGVELGKELARGLIADIEEGQTGEHDASTGRLMEYYFHRVPRGPH